MTSTVKSAARWLWDHKKLVVGRAKYSVAAAVCFIHEKTARVAVQTLLRVSRKKNRRATTDDAAHSTTF